MEKERVEREQRKQQLENEKLEKKRKQEEAIRQAQELREQQQREKEAREEAARMNKEKQKLINFFGNSTNGAVQAASGFSSVAKATVMNSSKTKLIGGNQITNDVRQARLPSSAANHQLEESEVFADYSVLTEAHQI